MCISDWCSQVHTLLTIATVLQGAHPTAGTTAVLRGLGKALGESCLAIRQAD